MLLVPQQFTWHFYRSPSIDNVFNPIARNVGPGGAYTLWSCALYVVKNSEFATQAYVPQTLTRYNLGASGVGMPYLFYGGGRGSGAGSVRETYFGDLVTLLVVLVVLFLDLVVEENLVKDFKKSCC